MENVHLAASTVQRLTLYQKYLQQLPKQIRTVTPNLLSEALAIDLKVIRQDMKILLSKDRVNEENREAFEKAIVRNSVYRKINVVVLAGVGKLGKALMSCAGFAACYVYGNIGLFYDCSCPPIHCATVDYYAISHVDFRYT